MGECYVGIDLGGTKVATVLTNKTGRIIAADRRPTDAAAGSGQVLKNISDGIKTVISGIDRREIKGIGIASPGPLDIRKGIIVATPNLPWKNFPLCAKLVEEFQLPCAMENDANAAALGEWFFGAGKKTRDLIYITVSTGIGGGIICNGRIIHGRDDAAGEIGHMFVAKDGPRCGCGKYGCLEAVASGTAIGKEAKRLIAAGRTDSSILLKVNHNPELINAKIVAEAALENDPLAVEIFTRAINYLGSAIANLIQIFNPEIIIIGGGVAKIGAMLFEGIWPMIRANTFEHTIRELPIVPPALGDNCGSLGAAALAINCFGKGSDF
jgi:glucokinase